LRRQSGAERQKLKPKPDEAVFSESGEAFDYPAPPDVIPEWALEEASGWRGLSRFDMEVRAEECSGLEVEIRQTPLPPSVWGLHVSRGSRVRLCVNSELPDMWRRFATFHELYHLIAHSMGERFWRNTYQPMSKFESEADLFAWAAIWPEWTEGVWDSGE